MQKRESEMETHTYTYMRVGETGTLLGNNFDGTGERPSGILVPCSLPVKFNGHI